MQSSKTRSLLLLAASTAVSALAAFGCGDIALEPIQAQLPATNVLDSNDPYACELVRNEKPLGRNATEAYDPTCKATGTRCAFDGSGSVMPDDETGEVAVHQELRMVCALPCQSDSELPGAGEWHRGRELFLLREPSPENAFGECILRCDGGERCPEGFECDESRGATNYAVWPESCIGSAVTFDYSYTEPAP